MASEHAAPPLLPSGLAPVDAAWGGLLRGGSYLVVAPAASRGRLTLAALSAATDGLSLLVSPRSPEALLAEAAEGNIDLAGAYRQGRVKLLRAPAAADLTALGDAGLARALDDLAALARHHRPERLLVEDFSAFVRFSSFEAFAAAFRAFAEAAAALPTALVLGLGEPANESSRRLLLFLQSEASGTLHAAPQPDGDVVLSLLPGVAHAGDALTVRWRFAAGPSVSPETTPEAQAGTAGAEAPAEPVGEDPLADDPFADDPFGRDDLPPAGSDGSSRSADLALSPPNLVARPSAPSGDADWTAVTPVNPAEAPLPQPADDPFATKLGPDLLALGHFVDSRTSDAPPAGGDGLAGGLDGAAASVHEGAYPELFTPPAEPPAEPPAASPTGDPADAFRHALDSAFARQAAAGTPFLVLALRLDPDGAHTDLLPAVAHALDGALGPGGALYGDPATGRLIALLPGAAGEAAPGLLGAVRTHLGTVAPGRADEALRAIGALVVSNGEPFGSAGALLDYVFAG